MRMLVIIFVFLLSTSSLYSDTELLVDHFVLYSEFDHSIIARLNESADKYFNSIYLIDSPLITEGLTVYFSKKSHAIISIHVRNDMYYLKNDIRVGTSISDIIEKIGFSHYQFSRASNPNLFSDETSECDGVHIYYYNASDNMSFSLAFFLKDLEVQQIWIGIAME